MPERPPYPPARVWSFPPPELGRRWFWIAIAAMATALIGGVGLLVVSGVVVSRDSTGVINDPVVLTAIERECTDMTQQVQGIAGSAIPESRMIRQQNDAVDAMVRRIGALPAATLDGDRPTRAWLADWEALVEARAEFARGRTSRIVVPKDEAGDPITDRMEAALLDPVCPVPIDLVDPGARDEEAI